MKNNQISSILADPNEQIVSVLGNSIFQNFLANGFLGKGFAILSDKRVYFKGKCFVRSGEKFISQQEERVVDVNDVTGTGFVHKSNSTALFIAIICLFLSLVFGYIMKETGSGKTMFFILLLLFAVCLVAYFKKQTFFEIAFAGGGIAFKVNWFPAEESQAFQKNLRLVKDASKSQNRQANESVAQASTTADELQKYANLFAQGMITQEEFDSFKATLLK